MRNGKAHDSPAYQSVSRARSLFQWPDERAPVLLVSPVADDHAWLPQILNHPNWIWRRSRSYGQALQWLRRDPIAVVLCEREQQDGCWQDVLQAADRLKQPPRVIVCSRLADEPLWAEVLNLGGYDVLAKPFDAEEVVRVANAAWRGWKGDGGQTATWTAPLKRLSTATG
ncbi:MAG: response regulator [Acidobacteriia bacterium]|nr:response regulator [Terriglobia bacterium]